MKQVIKTPVRENITIANCDYSKYYGVVFDSDADTVPKLFLGTANGFYSVFRFDEGTNTSVSNFLAEQKFDKLADALDFLISRHYIVYQFDTFLGWYDWYSDVSSRLALKLKKKRKPRFRQNTSDYWAAKIHRSSDFTEEKYYAARVGRKNNNTLFLTKKGKWESVKVGLRENMYFDSEAEIEAFFEKITNKK